MIKYQVLIIFLIIVFAFWIGYTMRERRKARENQEDENDNSEENIS